MRATAPSASDVRQAVIKGFVQDLTLWDPIGYTETNLDVGGIPFTGFDVHPVSDKQATVNGVVFKVQPEDTAALLEREREYKVLRTPAYDFATGKSLGTCLVFSSGANDAAFDPNSKPQNRYLQICLSTAESYGPAFLGMFLETTYVGGRTLKDQPGLVAELMATRDRAA
jgi:hypothetical protein